MVDRHALSSRLDALEGYLAELRSFQSVFRRARRHAVSSHQGDPIRDLLQPLLVEIDGARPFSPAMGIGRGGTRGALRLPQSALRIESPPEDAGADVRLQTPLEPPGLRVLEAAQEVDLPEQVLRLGARGDDFLVVAPALDVTVLF